MKNKLKLDTERLESDLVQSRRNEYKKLSKRIVSDFRHQNILESSRKIVSEVERDRKNNEEIDRSVPHCTKVLEMAFYDKMEENAQKELENEETLIEKFNSWGL